MSPMIRLPGAVKLGPNRGVCVLGGTSFTEGASGGGAFDPSTVPGLQAWYKADALAGTDGTAIASWADSSTNGRTLAQATGANQPLLKTGVNGINSKNVVRFDGVNDSMDYLPLADWISGTTVTIFAVVKRIAIVTDAGLCSAVADAAPNDFGSAQGFICGYEASPGTTVNDFRNNASLSGGSHPGNGVAYVHESVWDGTNETQYVNGTGRAAVASAGTFAVRRLIVGARWTGSALGNFANRDYGELLIYNTAVSTANRSSIRSYLGTKWGITVV